VDDIRGAERGCHFTYRCDGPGSLYNRANGYSYDAEKIFCDKNGKVTRCRTWSTAARRHRVHLG
jgi:hypothetical protein